MEPFALVLIIIMAMVIMASMIWKPNMAMCSIVPVAAIFFVALRSGGDISGFTEPPGVDPDPVGLTYEATPDPSLDTCREHAPPDPWHPKGPPDAVSAERMAGLRRDNATALNELYGRRYNGTVDNALWAHKQRIGDRDHQATINQIKGRRNNVYEPYYRQELSERNSERWWEPDNRLVMQANKRWMDTVDMNRDLLRDANVDGIYSQW
jgi:hypothetical protein